MTSPSAPHATSRRWARRTPPEADARDRAAARPYLIGQKKTRELLLTGDLIDAVEAERIGLVNRVVPADRLVAEVDALALGKLDMKKGRSPRAPPLHESVTVFDARTRAGRRPQASYCDVTVNDVLARRDVVPYVYDFTT